MYNKYSNKKCRCASGHTHDSKKEAKRCNELTILENAGIISGLHERSEERTTERGEGP